MQKKVIALAVAALASGAAMAQTSNVTMYGIIDVDAISLKTSNKAAASSNNLRGVVDNPVGSRLGFKGTEALGQGLSADFVMEFGLGASHSVEADKTNSTALSNFNTRQSYVALTSTSLGQVALGRFNGIGWELMANARPWGGFDPMRTAANMIGIQMNTSDRLSNAIQYTSPTWSGFSFKGQYSSDSKSTTSETEYNNAVSNDGTTLSRRRVYEAAVKYVNGPIDVMGAYRNYSSVQYGTNDGRNELGIRGSYDFGVAKVGAVYQNLTLNNSVAVTGGDFKKAYYYGGYVTVPVTPTFLVTLEGAKSSGDQSQGGYGYMVNGEYKFSKRTSLYAQAGYMKANNGNFNGATATGAANATNGATYTVGTLGQATALEAGRSAVGGLVGLMHTF